MPVEQVLDRHARHHGIEVPPKRRAVALEQYPADYALRRRADRSADHAAREADDGPHAGDTAVPATAPTFAAATPAAAAPAIPPAIEVARHAMFCAYWAPLALPWKSL